MHRVPRPGVTGLVAAAVLAAMVLPGLASGSTPPGLPSTLSGIHMAFGMQGRLSTTSQSEAVAAAGTGDIVVGLPLQIKQFGAAMKTANPHVQLYAYENGMFAQAKDGSTFPNSWYLRTASGAKVQAVHTGNYLMNPLSTESFNGIAGWTAYVTQQCRSDLTDPNATGCFLDQMNAAPLGSGFVNGAPVDPRTGSPFTASAYMGLVATQGKAVAAGLNGAPVIGNSYDSAPRYYGIPTSIVNSAAGLGALEAEHWFGNDTTQAQTLSAWKQGVQMELDAQTAGHGVIVNVDGPGANPEQWRRYIVASYLLGNNGAAWLDFAPDSSTAPYDSLSPVYSTPIGTPTETFSTVDGYAKDGLYERTYSNGLVLVNPSGASVTVSLGATYTNESGASVTSVTVPAYSGVLLTGGSGSSGSGSGGGGSTGGTGSGGTGSGGTGGTGSGGTGGTGSGGTGGTGSGGYTGSLSGTWASGSPWKYQIGWVLAQQAPITVTISDASGSVVRHRVTNTVYPGGANKVNWYGWTDGHVRVAPGVYTAKVTAGDTTQSVQLTVS